MSGIASRMADFKPRKVGRQPLASAVIIEKAGPEGYIHGWVCVKPPCGNAHDLIMHPDHGVGIISHVDDDGTKHGYFYGDVTGPLGEQGDHDEVAAAVKKKTDAETAERRARAPLHAVQNENLTHEEEMLVSGYTQEQGNRLYNDSLRRGEAPSEGHLKLDRAIAKSSASKDGFLYRGLALSEGQELKPGTEFTDPAYVSTTKDRDIAEAFAVKRATGADSEKMPLHPLRVYGGKAVIVRIPVKKGDHMMPGAPEINEFILPRGQRYRVTTVDDDGTVNLEQVK